MQKFVSNISALQALALLIDKNMLGENFYSTHDYLNPALFGRNKKFIKVYSYYSNDAEKKAIAGFVYDLEQSLGQFTYNVLTNTIEYYNYSYPLTVAAATSTDGKELISQTNMRADPTNDMEIATKHYVDNSIATNSVLYTAQSLTEEQKEQARKNIGAQDENNGLTPVTVTYINPFYNTTDTSTTYLLQGTLKVFDDNSPTDVKKAFTIVMNVLGGHAAPTGTAGCRDLFDKLRILYDNGLITIPFKAYPNKYDRNYWVSLSAYQNKYIFFNCVRSDKADGFNVTLRYDLETNAYVENSCYSEQAVKSSLKGLTGTPTIMQVQIQSDPTTDKEIATKHYVDNAPIKQASATELGGVKVGTGLAIADDGTLSFNSASAAGLTPVSYSCTDGTYSVSDTVYLESGNIISPTDTVSNDVRLAFRYINLWNIPNQLDYWKDDIKKYKLLIDNGYLENNTIWYSKPDKKFKKQIRFGTNSTLGDYIIFNFNYDYEVIGQLVYYVDTDTISTGTDTYLNRNLKRDKNNVLSYSAIKLASDPTEPMQIATKQYVDNALSGDRWELINAIEIADGTEETNALTISIDKNGNTFSLKKARLITYFPKYTGESSIPGFSFTMINGFVSGPQAPLCYTSGLPTPNNSNNPEGWLEVDLSMPGYEVERVARFAGSGNPPAQVMHWGARRLNGAETITSIGGTNMLIYPGCKFILYGVRA